MVLVLFVAWSFVFLGMIKGIKSSGKVMYFATSFPYVVLIAFFIRAMLLDGAADGVAYMFSPHVSFRDVQCCSKNLFSYDVTFWCRAA